AQAQEESLARSSALYDSLISQSDYYDANRACGTCLYTDHMILSPHVPVFRHDSGELRDEPYLLSFLTSPAVNAGAIKKNERPKIPQIRAVMARRIQYVLNVALENQYKTLVLGAWGCGVFRNDPAEIAELFSESLLNDPRYQNRFRKVTFAVLDNEQEKIIAPFRERFAA
ncbi:MAG: TIGR02452 family protein, partial [Planctomycetaceae bacterium]|nr:TIGR02452 family protein [Planctomycetaceae bacterium]